MKNQFASNKKAGLGSLTLRLLKMAFEQFQLVPWESKSISLVVARDKKWQKTARACVCVRVFVANYWLHKPTKWRSYPDMEERTGHFSKKVIKSRPPGLANAKIFLLVFFVLNLGFASKFGCTVFELFTCKWYCKLLVCAVAHKNYNYGPQSKRREKFCFCLFAFTKFCGCFYNHHSR